MNDPMTNNIEVLRGLAAKWHERGDTLAKEIGLMHDDDPARRALKLALDTMDRCRHELEAALAAMGGQGEAQAELTEQQKADRDAVMYGTGFMLGGKHIPADQVTVFSAERIDITPQQPEAQAGGPVADAPDPTLCAFYEVDSWPALVAAQEEHVLKLQDAARRNVKPWEDTFPPTLLPKYLRDSGLAPHTSGAEPWYGHKFFKGRDGLWRCFDGCGPTLAEVTTPPPSAVPAEQPEAQAGGAMLNDDGSLTYVGQRQVVEYMTVEIRAAIALMERIQQRAEAIDCQPTTPPAKVPEVLLDFAERIEQAEPWLHKGAKFTRWAKEIAADMRERAAMLAAAPAPKEDA